MTTSPKMDDMEPTPEQWQEFYDRVWDTDEANPTLTLLVSELQRIGRAMLSTIATPQESRSEVLWTDCHFKGAPPPQYKDWLDFVNAKMKSGVVISSLASRAEPGLQWTECVECGMPEKCKRIQVCQLGPASAAPEPSVDYARGLEEGARTADEIAAFLLGDKRPLELHELIQSRWSEAILIGRAIRAKINPRTDPPQKGST